MIFYNRYSAPRSYSQLSVLLLVATTTVNSSVAVTAQTIVHSFTTLYIINSLSAGTLIYSCELCVHVYEVNYSFVLPIQTYYSFTGDTLFLPDMKDNVIELIASPVVNPVLMTVPIHFYNTLGPSLVCGIFFLFEIIILGFVVQCCFHHFCSQ